MMETFSTPNSSAPMSSSKRTNNNNNNNYLLYSQPFMSPMTTFIVDDDEFDDYDDISNINMNQQQQFTSPMISFTAFDDDDDDTITEKTQSIIMNHNNKENNTKQQQKRELDSIRKHLPSLFITTNMIGMWSNEKKQQYKEDDDDNNNMPPTRMLHTDISLDNILNQTIIVTPTESIDESNRNWSVDVSNADDNNNIEIHKQPPTSFILDNKMIPINDVVATEELKSRHTQNILDNVQEIKTTSTSPTTFAITNPPKKIASKQKQQKRRVFQPQHSKTNGWKISARTLFFIFFILSLIAFIVMSLYCYVIIEKLEQNWDVQQQQEQEDELLNRNLRGGFYDIYDRSIMQLTKSSDSIIAAAISLPITPQSLPDENHSIERSPIVATEDHRHSIPNNIIFTHKLDLLNTVFPFQNKSTSLLTPDEKELLALQNNAINIIKLHPSANVQFLTNDDCIDRIRLVMTTLYNSTAAEELVNHFINEKEGMYKGDLCRGIALYENGGLYFDVDIGVRMNLWNVIQPLTEFVTIRVHTQSHNVGAFFQAFIGVTSHHIVIQRYIELFYMYYTHTISQYDKIKGKPLGVVLLKRAYDEIEHEQQKHHLDEINHNMIDEHNTDEQIAIGPSISQSEKTKYDYTGLQLNQTSELWQEVLYIPELHKSMLKYVPYPTWGTRRACKFIVVSSIQSENSNNTLNHDDKKKNTKFAVVPFYSRIADSRMCPSVSENNDMQEKIVDSHHHHKHDHSLRITSQHDLQRESM